MRPKICAIFKVLDHSPHLQTSDFCLALVFVFIMGRSCTLPRYGPHVSHIDFTWKLVKMLILRSTPDSLDRKVCSGGLVISV